ncbi:unnamed protein product [Fraxinus pennsylvanica]|uniref:Reverse transcriptase zinc-binding domain-containing protein n=1 Tax=Fraxinus pennsylvanica TaxID=56036 RepID=A0AAD1Z0U2_9LAMI|nr:unnamed protein product [Fraxinus pennsylvanica]
MRCKGDMVATGGNGASPANNIAQESSFHFMPTPMVARKVERGRVTPGQALMMPIRDQHEPGYSVEDNVPTEVNFKEMVDELHQMDANELSKLRAARARKRRAAKMTKNMHANVNVQCNVKTNVYLESGWDVERLHELVGEEVAGNIMQKLHACKPRRDILIWKPQKQGIFTSRSAWDMLRIKVPEVHWAKWAKNKAIPKRVSLAMWKALSGNLSVDSRIRKVVIS